MIEQKQKVKFLQDPDDEKYYLELYIHIVYNEKTYDISYDYNYANINPNIVYEDDIYKHFHIDFEDDNFDGVIVAKNPMTDVIVNFLLMTDDELRVHSGLSRPDDYRKIIMKNLADLWD
jgi:hypothetical protein